MTDGSDPFRFEYDPGTIHFGEGCVASLGDEIARLGAERALVVCGQTVGTTPPVIDPVKDGIGDRLAGVFAETTPEKRLGTAVDGAAAMVENDADVIVSLGGGSSLDTAKAVAIVVASDKSPDELGQEFAETGTLTVPDGTPPILAVPTTLAGADLSQGAGLSADPESGLVDEQVGGGIGDPQLLPAAAFYDPSLFATTPRDVLLGSAMNGLDKGIETLYSSNATAITDATAMRGLDLFRRGLLDYAGDDENDSTDGLAAIVEGLLLVQYGISRPDGSTLSVIHAFGHGITAWGTVQQGVAHCILAPHVLASLFERVDGRRDLLAEALGVDDADADADETAAAIVDAVTEVRDALDLPTQLRDVDGPDRDEFDEVAEYVCEDSFMANAPDDLDADPETIEAVLEAAW